MKEILIILSIIIGVIPSSADDGKIPKWNHGIKIINNFFIEKIDSIISNTKISPKTEIWSCGRMDTSYTSEVSVSEKEEILSQRKCFIVELYKPDLFSIEMLTYPVKGTQYDKINIDTIDSLFINIIGMDLPEKDCYYVKYKGKHYFFKAMIDGIFKRTNEKSVVWQPSGKLGTLPDADWLIEYNNGHMKLVKFFFNYYE
jgi:hypothetical protein